MPPWTLIPLRMAPMACSRMPKCRVRPYGWPGKRRDCRSAGRKLGSPSMVVLLDSARSAEPPHSSGSFGASAVSTLPDAARVATPLASASQEGSASSQPGDSSPTTSRSWRALPSGLAAAHWSYASCQSATAALPRSTRSRVWSRTSSETSKVRSGSNPSARLVACTSSAPRAEPCDLPVPRAFGAGQAMIVFSWMKLGRSVTSRAAFSAASRAGMSSAYSVSPWVQSTVCTCQP